MKFTTYTPQVQKTAGGDAKVVVPQNIGAAGMLTARGINALNQGLGAVNNLLFKRAADADKTTATAANNEYTQRLNDLLYNDKDGLLHTQMKGADGITSVFEEKEKKIREEVAKKYKYNFEAGRQEFDAMASRTYAQRLTSVQNHMYAESKKYRDVTFSNAIDNQARFAAENYSDAAMVNDAMAGALAHVDNYYAGQGTEVVQQQRRRIAGKVAELVVGRAYAENDYAKAEYYISKYGMCFTPEQKTSLKKGIAKKAQLERNRQYFVTLAAQYQDLPTYMAKVSEMYDNLHANVEDYGMPTQGANIDEQVKQLRPEFQAALPQIGGILKNIFNVEGVISSGGRTKEHQMEINPSAPNSYHIVREGGGDAVDIVLPDDVTDEQAAKIKKYFESSGAFAEVLYHDAGSGYHLHLGGYQGGLAHKTSPVDKEEYLQTALAEYKKHQHLQNVYTGGLYSDMNKELMALRDAGNANWKDYTDIVERIAAGNPELRKKGYQAGQYWWGQVVGGTGTGSRTNPWGGPTKGGKSLDFGMKQRLQESLMYHDFETEADWSDFVIRYHPSKDEYGTLMNMYKQKQEGKGAFQYNWTGMEKSFKAMFPKLSDEQEVLAWRQAQSYAVQQINKIRETEHREPTDEDVLGFLKDSMMEVNVGEIVTPRPVIWDKKEPYAPTKGRLAREDVMSVNVLPTQQVEVTMSNGAKYIFKDVETFRDMVNSGALRNRNRASGR